MLATISGLMYFASNSYPNSCDKHSSIRIVNLNRNPMSRNFIPDETLIDQLFLDDTGAFEEIYNRYWYSLYSYSLKKLGSRNDARRIVKDIFISLWEQRHTYKVGFSVSLHLYSEVRKCVIRRVNEKLELQEDLDVMEERIIPGFTVSKLQEARKPVQHSSVKPEIYTPAREPWWNAAPGGITLKDIRYYLEKVLNLI